MPLQPWMASFWRNLRHRDRVDAALDEEMRACLEMLVDEKLAAGLNPEAARRAARLEFGGLEQVKEQVQEVRAGAWLESLSNDIRYAVRSLASTPTVTLAALVSLTLGIGLNTAVFSVIHAVVLNPPPYKDPARLVNVAEAFPAFENDRAMSPADYLDLARENRVFERMAAIDRQTPDAVVQSTGGARRIPCLRVSAAFFDILGVPAARGRTFTAAEDTPHATVAVVSDQFWREHLRADPGAVGRELIVDDAKVTVIGVMSPSFRFYHPLLPSLTIEIWRPYAFLGNTPDNRHLVTITAIARLKRGITVEAARAATDAVVKHLHRRYPRTQEFAGAHGWVELVQADLARPGRQAIAIAWGSVTLVLLVACANVASLLLARAGARQREFAVRASLGAGRLRLMRQLLAESLMLSAAGGAAGLLLAHWSTAALVALLPGANRIGRLDEAALNLPVVMFTAGGALLVGLLVGLAPAWRASKVDLRSALVQAPRAMTESRGALRLRHALVTGQLALSVVLLAGAGLLVNTLAHLYRVPLGFDTDQVLTFRSFLPMTPAFVTDLGLSSVGDAHAITMHRWSLTDRTLRFPNAVVGRVRQVPGVENAAVTINGLPMIYTFFYDFALEGQPAPSAQQKAEMHGELWKVTPGYFETLRVPLAQGRLFRDADILGRPLVAIINRHMADTFWPDRTSVIGERITTDTPERTYEIVGVVGDIRPWPELDTSHQMYVPLTQAVVPSYDNVPARYRLQFSAVVRTHGDPMALAREIRHAVGEAEAGAPVDELKSLDDAVDNAFGRWRSMLWLLGLNAGLAVLLSAVGLYGVTAYSVTQRTHEIGIRMALGADAHAVLALVLRRAVWVTGTGIVAGVTAAFWATKLIEHSLYRVSPSDPWTLMTVAVLLLIVALAAAYFPARRAAAIDPMQALRCE